MKNFSSSADKAPKIITVTLNPCMDKTVQVSRFATGQTNRVLDSRTDIGGKGINVARVLQGSGVECIAAGLGSPAFIRRLTEAGLSTAFCETDGETRTNLKVIDSETGEMTEINEKGLPAGAAFAALQKRLTALLPEADVLVLSGSVPPDLSETVYKDLTALAADFGVRVILDADGAYFKKGLEAKPFAVKPNRAELERLVGKKLDTVEDILREAAALNRQGIALVAVSLGAEGAVFVQSTQAVRTVPFPITVGSAAAAGDSMVAMLAYAMVHDLSLSETARLMTAAGTVTASLSGTQVAGFSEILRRAADIKTEIY